jgi:tRNA(Leu) C34 or U34 (ribose-2'-O)-methylase TrmL
MFCTALYHLKSPQNVGMIVRAHVAFGGQELLFIGRDRPWRFSLVVSFWDHADVYGILRD